MTRNVRTLLLCIPLLTAGTQTLYAQEAAPAAATKLETVAEGELRLDGKITAITGASEWGIQAFSFTSPRGVTKEFDAPKSKTVVVNAETKIHPRGQEDAVTFRDVKLGTPIGVIGKNGPENSIIAREIILLEGYGRGKTIGMVTVNGETSRLLRQGRAAMEGGQVQKAISLFGQAASAAQGFGDVRGETLSLRDQARAYAEAQLPAKAKDAYMQAIQRSTRSGHGEDEASARNGLALVLSNEGNVEEAAKQLEQAEQVGVSADPRMRVIILHNLTSMYLQLKRVDDTIAVLRRVCPLEESTGQTAEAIGTGALMAYLLVGTDADKAKEALAKVEPRLAQVRDPKAKAGILSRIGATKWKLGDQTAGRADLETAIQLLGEAGDTKGAEAVRARIKALETDKAEVETE